MANMTWTVSIEEDPETGDAWRLVKKTYTEEMHQNQTDFE